MNKFKRVSANHLCSNMGYSILQGIENDETVEVVHACQKTKIILNEDRYMQLLGFWHIYEKATSAPIPYDGEALLKEALEVFKERREIAGKKVTGGEQLKKELKELDET